MKYRFLSVLFALLLPITVSANLCEKSNITDRHRNEAKLIRAERFASGTNPSLDYIGDDEYNAWILACNRQRDNQGKEIDEKINPKTGGKFADNLPEVSIKGQYSFYGNSGAANAFTSLEYRYRLRRSKQTWIATLPIELIIDGVVYGKDKDNLPIPISTNRIDIPQFLAVKLGLMSRNGKGNLKCDKGQEKFKSSPLPDVTPKKVVDTGFIGPEDATYDGVACRLPMDSKVPGGKRLLNEYHSFWKEVIQTAWNRPGFEVKVLIIGHDTIDDTLMKELKRDDQIWRIHFSLDPNTRPRYRSGFLSVPHFYTGAYSETIAHEAGHELGLDDEYRENDKGIKNEWRDCAGDTFGLPGATYGMCISTSISSTSSASWWKSPYAITNPEALKGIYPWIITRRYAVGLASQCFANSDCSDQQYCDKGEALGVGRNQCLAKKKENDKCGADDQCVAPAICKGKPLGRCATEETIKLGGKCTKDIQCTTGSCNSDGVCQCAANSDCNDNQFCEKGGVAGVGKNQCEAKKTENEKCGADDQCLLPAICKDSRCITEGSVKIGGSCSRNSQCKTGNCDNNGICQCDNNNDCGDKAHCEKGFLGAGRNVCVNNASTVNLGDKCYGDSECISGSCSSKGHCQCKRDTDCKKKGQKCKEPIGKENYCSE